MRNIWSKYREEGVEFDIVSIYMIKTPGKWDIINLIGAIYMENRSGSRREPCEKPD